MRRRVLPIASLILAGTFGTTYASGTQVLYVDDDAPVNGDGLSWATAYDSLGTALTAAESGDQIWAAAGTYIGNFTLALEVELYGGFAGTETELGQRDWEANPTILDGNQTGSVVTSPAGATETTRIDGFTITNGSADNGGGLFLDHSSPTIANNTIVGNNAFVGGGLFLDFSSPTIANNVLTGNVATYGAGLFLDSSSPTIENNTVKRNSATYGGGLYLESSSPTITNNTLTGNNADDGGGLYLSSSSATIANNTIRGNSTSRGGALFLHLSSPSIANNTITGNGASTGGGLYLYESLPMITNTIVAFNSSGIHLDYGDAPTLRCNCVYGNTAYDYSGLTDPTGTDGNISTDPLLAGQEYGNVHIQPDSPCVDTGNNADTFGDLDMDGEPRIQHLGGTVDIGADESDGTVWPAGSYTIVRVSAIGDDGNEGSSWALAKRTVQAGVNVASALGGEVWVQAGTYEERITLHPYAYVYGGFAGDETARDQRDWSANVTTLDGQQEGSVVTARAGYRVSTIDGFTITNGSAGIGGGLYMRGSSPVIANNTITGNSAQDGGGLFLDSSSPTIANNTITANSASGSGGGLWLRDSCPTIANNRITVNGAHYGGGLYLDSSSPTIANNTITGNSAREGGGLLLDSSSPTMSNNTITANGAGTGGGLYLYESSPTIANTIVAFNSSGIYLDYGDTPTLRYNCVYGNTAYNYSGLTDPTGTDGNIWADPRLVDPRYGDAHIQPDSPCVDTGNNADASGDLDIDGEPRIQDGTVDIGADESDGTVWPAGPYIVVRVGPTGDDWNDGSSWAFPKLTVQAGIDLASVLGGEVWVQADTYEERITLHPYAYVYGGFVGDETTRDQRDWSANVTTLDGQQEGSVVTARAGFGTIGAIDGFTITNGSAYKGGGLYLDHSSPGIANNTITGNSADDSGGGVYMSSSSPTIANNTITGNGSADDGGGLYLRYSSPKIVNNTITGNSASGSGGGLCVGGFSSVTISNNTITGNSARYGGGLYLSSSPTIANNTITGNSAEYAGGGLYLYCCSPTIANNTITVNGAGYGGGLCLWGSSSTIANNTITGNSADDSGGGLYMYSSSPTIANNTITSNRTDRGGGLYLSNSSATIANNTITGNGGSTGGGLYLYESSPTIANTIVAFNSSGIYRYDTVNTPTLRHNCVYGNTAYDYDGLTDPTGTDGNISDDPRLADSHYGHAHIQPDSPCVDTGNNADAFSDFDIDGEPRIQPLGGTIDIGADESDGTVWPAGPYVVVRVSPAGHDANDGSSWAFSKRTVQAGIDMASMLGGEVWVQAGTYYERVTLPPYVYLYGGFTGDETARDLRDWKANLTTLDGQQQGSVVTARAGYRVSAIDGFTITNGSADSGGGLYLSSSSPTIANNTITSNGADNGGGLYLDKSSPTIANNTITGNSASGTGGGLYLESSSPTIANNTITINNSSGSGGGLYLDNSSPTIANNTITVNGARYGGGLYLYESSPTIANTIVAFNSSGIDRFDTISTPTLRHNCVYGNTAYDYSGVTDATGTDGNISADPVFADLAYGNVHIQPGSPCLDAGNNADACGDFDMDGQLRVQGETVDIGADESVGTLWPAGPYTIVRVSPKGDDANDGSSWALAKRTVQASIDAAFALGGEVWVQAGVYYERITLNPCAYVYGGFAGGETARDQRDWSANVTTLDGQQEGSVVTARASYGAFGAIDGFAITNGSADNGGAVYLDNSSPTIANNTITGNTARDGGGLFLDSSSPTIANNTITGNSADDSGGGLYLSYSSPTIEKNTITSNRGDRGGGLYLRWDSFPTITNNTITGNDADDGGGLFLASSSAAIANNMITGNNASGSGGGLYLSSSSPTVANNTITGNDAGDGGGLYLNRSSPTIAKNMITGNDSGDGGGLYLYRSSPTIENNTITGNGADDLGGGLCLLYSSSPTIANNMITGNGAGDSGGGLCLSSYSSPRIANNTITGNEAGDGGGLCLLYSSSPTIANTVVAFNSSGVYRVDTDSAPTLRHNCVYGNTAYDYSGLADPTGTDGNISSDPVLAQNPAPGPDGYWGTSDDDFGDLHLLSGSPCINAGDNDAPELPLTDLDGHARILCEVVDMGAYEFGIGDYDCDQDIDLTDFAAWEACMTGPDDGPYDPECEPFDFEFDGDVDLNDFAALATVLTGP